MTVTIFTSYRLSMNLFFIKINSNHVVYTGFLVILNYSNSYSLAYSSIPTGHYFQDPEVHPALKFANSAYFLSPTTKVREINLP